MFGFYLYVGFGVLYYFYYYRRGEKKASGKKAKSDDGDSFKLGLKVELFKMFVYIMFMGDKLVCNFDFVFGCMDSECMEYLFKEFVREYGTAAIKSYVRLMFGVDVSDWFYEEDMMYFVFKLIMKNKLMGV